MTLKGEELTPNGEFQIRENIASEFNKQVSVSYMEPVCDDDDSNTTILLSSEEWQVFHMIFVLKGRAELRNRRKNRVYVSIETQQHNLVCFNSKRGSIMLKRSHDSEIACLNLSNSFLDRFLPDSHPVGQLLSQSQQERSVACLFADNMFITPEIAAILQGMGRPGHSGFCAQLILESKVINLLALQISQFEQMEDSFQALTLKKEELEKMQQVREILINHTGEKLSLKTLALMVGTNEFTLKRNFKLAFGHTVYGYLNQYKMEQARNMLIEQENITIAEVSAKIGYKYPTHFSSAFKKYFGYLPHKLISAKMQLLFIVDHMMGLIDAFSLSLI